MPATLAQSWRNISASMLGNYVSSNQTGVIFEREYPLRLKKLVP